MHFDHFLTNTYVLVSNAASFNYASMLSSNSVIKHFLSSSQTVHIQIIEHSLHFGTLKEPHNSIQLSNSLVHILIYIIHFNFIYHLHQLFITVFSLRFWKQNFIFLDFPRILHVKT
jgi:hypothetical protein